MDDENILNLQDEAQRHSEQKHRKTRQKSLYELIIRYVGQYKYLRVRDMFLPSKDRGKALDFKMFFTNKEIL